LRVPFLATCRDDPFFFRCRQNAEEERTNRIAKVTTVYIGHQAAPFHQNSLAEWE
jgi:hypothetical protein